MPLNINVSDKAAEKRKPFEDLPQGWFVVQITDVELRESQSEKNSGKPMYNFEFTVTDDERNPQDENGASKYSGRRLWTNACLWEGAEFTIVNILRALGHDVLPGNLAVPDVTNPQERDALFGQFLQIRNGVTRKERAAARKEKREATTEITDFKSASDEDDSTTAVPQTGVVRGGLGGRRVLA